MNKRQLVKTIAQRLPFTTVRQVEEVLEVAAEVWSNELEAGGQAQIPGIGSLSIAAQQLRAAGAIQSESGMLRRSNARLRVTGMNGDDTATDADSLFITLSVRTGVVLCR